jgi:hypothetical protein
LYAIEWINQDVGANVNESRYAIEWINQDVGANVNESQYGGLPGTSAVLALVNLIHKWYLAMETPVRVIRIYLYFLILEKLM